MTSCHWDYSEFLSPQAKKKKKKKKYCETPELGRRDRLYSGFKKKKNKTGEELLQKQQEVLTESALGHCVEGLQISN